MRLLMIATLYTNNDIIGHRILDVESKENKYMDVSVSNIKEVISTGKATIENLGIQDGKLVGTNGIVDRYPKLTIKGVPMQKVSPLTIIDQIEDVGYKVVDYKGEIKLARVSDVVRYAKEYGISNGKVVMRDNLEFISSIAGNYNVIAIPKSKVNNNNTNDVKIHVALKNTKETGTLANNTKVEVDVEIEDNDVFACMTDDQKEVLKSYYVWYTVDKYKSLAKSIRLDLNTDKAERLAQLRGETNWEFGGVWDSGFMGGSCCELGHTLRYEYYAVPEDDRDNEDARIVFGETCASDFFHINPEDMKSLVKTREIMSDEIKLMADIIVNNQEALYVQKAKLLYQVLKKLGTQEKIVGLFGNKIGYTLLGFLATKLPFPMSLVLECSKVISKDVENFYRTLYPEYRKTLYTIYQKHSNVKLITGGRIYLDFMATNQIEGDYAYNPLDESIKRRDVGRYNKQTRYERSRLLGNIKRRALCKKFTLEEIEAYLKCIERLNSVNNKVVDILNRNSVEYTKEWLISFTRTFVCSTELRPEEKEDRAIVYNSLLVNDRTCEPYTSVLAIDNGDEIYETSIIGLSHKLGLITSQMEDDILALYEIAISKEMDIIRKEQEYQEIEEEQINEVLNTVEKERDKIDDLKDLLDSKEYDAEDYGIKVAKSIIETGKSYNDLSPKQRWRIETTIAKLEGTKKDQVNKDDNNNVYDLETRPDLFAKVTRVLEKSGDKEIEKVLKSEPKVLDICLTVAKYNRVSDRQLKHIDNAISILDME